ncbi:hypothetical protein BG011_008304 [Mortierella polycephala]|uniref:Mitochondrial genome maintenance protein MGM101 n=1 Tax=Mortierella polycephala TaxID=41804 RepID=A0A9P6U8G7_9FUNG|nr:hypothetical protein BG011_008304 [Mortierella polycephala]
MATRTYVVKKDIGTAVKPASSTYATKTIVSSRATSAKTASTPASSYNKSDISITPSSTAIPKTSFSASPVSAASSYPTYADESKPGYDSGSSLSKVGGDMGQGTPSFTLSPSSNGSSPLKDAVIGESGAEDGQDWTRSFSGMAIEPFEKEVAEVLMSPLDPDDIEIKPGWGLAPRSEHSISPKTISREYALICRGRFVSTARGEQDYFDPSNLATASEGCKSNALMRCCKDLGVASELWDPSFIRKFKKQYCEEHFVEHAVTKKKKKLWKRKDQPDFDYPYSRTK